MKKSQKGVSLIITLFIMAIALGIVLGLSAILLGKIKVLREIGDSVVSLYVADSGVEQTYYFDRKMVPDGGSRGLCYICDICIYSWPSCQNCTSSGGDCDSLSCTNCQVNFSVVSNDKTYNIEALVFPTGDGTYENVIRSFGEFKGISRAIELNYGAEGGTPSDNPVITNASVVPRSVPSGIAVDISADIADPDGVDPATIFAYIQSPDENDIDTIQLTLSHGNEFSGTYIGTWTGPEGTYYVDIIACDIEGNCGNAENV